MADDDPATGVADDDATSLTGREHPVMLKAASPTTVITQVAFALMGRGALMRHSCRNMPPWSYHRS
jgi:hypothetical protein